MLSSFTQFYRVSSGLNRVLPSFTVIYLFLPSYMQFYSVLPSFVGFEPGFT